MYNLNLKVKDAKCSFALANIMETWIHSALKQSWTSFLASSASGARLFKISCDLECVAKMLLKCMPLHLL